MDSSTEKSILEEISTLVFDSLEKVSLKTISNNWQIKNETAKNVLMKWLEQNKKKSSEVSKEFLVTGINSKGVFSISVVPEAARDKLEKIWGKFAAFIYSVEVKSSSRKLNLPDYEPIKVKNILLNPEKPRDLHIPVIPDVVPKKEPEIKQKPTAKTPFNLVKPTKSDEKKVEVKKEDKPASPEKKETVVKAEKSSPEESKTASKPAAGKKGVKNQKPVQRGSISSFFSGKPGPSKVPEKPKVEVMEVDEDDQQAEKIESPAKKPATPENKSTNKPENKKKQPETKKSKKIKLKEPENSKKRSRIRVMEDSSEEEEAEKSESDEPDTKFIKFDREFTPEKETSPEKRESPEKSPEKPAGKRKAKRWVKKRFQTEDGFMRTENVLEEYSASEEETVNDENKKKNSPPKKTPPTKEKAEKKSAEKKKPTAKPTQTSKITSFFTKK